jgi:hypothetical protein
MRIHGGLVFWAALLAACPVFGQPQIGGGTCSSASLSGSYSLTLTGRDVGSSVTFSKIAEGIGTATFDGQNKVAFSLTNNTNQTFGTPETLSGTYVMQANCIGTIAIVTGDTAAFSLEAYDEGKNFLLTGQDGVYSFAGSGAALTATCGASQLSGNYAFNGTGFALSAGAVSGVNNISGTLQFDGKSAVSGTWYVAAGAATTTDSVSGKFTVTSACTGSATVTDSVGNAYTLLYTVTTADGSNFVLSGSNSTLMFSGNGRTI